MKEEEKITPFELAKASVSVREAAEMYGLKIEQRLSNLNRKVDSRTEVKSVGTESDYISEPTIER